MGVAQGVEDGELSVSVAAEAAGTAGSVEVKAGLVETWMAEVAGMRGGVGVAACCGAGVVVAEVEEAWGSSSESTSITTRGLFFGR